MSFIDDPRAETWDKYGRVYRPETIVIKSNSPLGGGIKTNVPSGTITTIENQTRITGQGSILDANNEKPAVGGRDEETIEEIKEQTKAFFTTQNRCVTKEDYEARVLNIPPKFGNIAKVYVSRVDTTQVFGETTTDIIETVSENVASLNQVQSLYSVNSLISDGFQPYATTNEAGNTIYNGVPEGVRSAIESSINFNTNLVNNIPTYTNNITNQIGLLPENPALTLGSIDVFVLAYNNTKNLVGNPIAGTTGFEDLTDGIPNLLENNIKNYLSNFKILTDDVNIRDGHIINFGVFFDVVSHKFANKSEVKLLCIEKIKDYFKIEKMQFSQPIYLSQ